MRPQITRKFQKGAALVEYALLLGLIALIAAGAIPTLGNKVSNSLVRTSCELVSPGSSQGSGCTIDNVDLGD